MSDLSVSKWEVSEFGGFRALLSDYPVITIDFDLDYEAPSEHEKVKDLGWYATSKLMKLFLLKVKEHKLTKQLVAGAKTKKVKVWGQEKELLIATPGAISHCLIEIIVKESELRNMFKEFSDVIKQSEFSYEIPKGNKNKGKDKKDGASGDGNDEDQSDGGSKSEGKDNDGEGEKSKSGGRNFLEMEALMRDFIAALEKTREGKPSGKFVGNDYVGGNLSKSAKFVLASKTGGRCRLSPQDERSANHLVKMLDITFDPESDKINSLKSGKLDACKIAEVVPGNTSIYYRVEENQTTKPFSICILGDESGSMSGNNIESQKKLMRILYKTFSEIVPQDKIFIYGHSDYWDEEGSTAGFGGSGRHGTPGIFVYHDKYNHIFEETIGSMKARGGNYDGPVIEAVYKKVREFTEDNIIFISISDGQPSGSGYGGSEAIADMKRIIEKCKRDGFVTIGIGFRYNGVKDIYNYNTVINDFKDMPKQVSGIVNQVVKTEFQS